MQIVEIARGVSFVNMEPRIMKQKSPISSQGHDFGTYVLTSAPPDLMGAAVHPSNSL
jgi:hypothetical protein